MLGIYNAVLSPFGTYSFTLFRKLSFKSLDCPFCAEDAPCK